MIRLTDEQWERIRKHFPEEHIPDGRAGRKPIPTRHVLEAVLWILNTGAQWHMLPQSYPNYETVHRRFQTWCCHEILSLVLPDVAHHIRENARPDNHHEDRLVQLGSDLYRIQRTPENFTDHRAYARPPLDEGVRNDGIEL